MPSTPLSTIPRSEYPRPQFERPDWLCLNGEWQFEIDGGDSGLERGLPKRELAGTIVVPFCPESELSGVANTDFLNAVWYRRVVRIPAAWNGRRVRLHFQAVDYDATVWVNGREVARHRGGFSPFAIDLGKIRGEAVIVVRARDTPHEPQPRGKQSIDFKNKGCHYTRTTGIWQTVWMEPVPEVYLKRARITPDVGQGMIRIAQPLSQNLPGYRIRATLGDEAGEIVSRTVETGLDFRANLDLAVPPERQRLWSPDDPHLYGISIELLGADGQVLDRVSSYAGLRSVTIQGLAVKINGRTLFQRLVLDQGYYLDGLMTAPSDEALIRDIELSLAAGFNGARLHQKVFEERFLYHCDRLGYLVWGEFGDWGCNFGNIDGNNQRPGATYITQWLEVLERDYSHPSIVGWCPLNESWQMLHDRITILDDVTRGMFLATKALDSTRPVLDTSGYSHRVPETDVYDTHCYEQDPETFAKLFSRLDKGKPYVNKLPFQNKLPINQPYAGQPFFVSEFGGIWWNPAHQGEAKWGDGHQPKSLEEFYTRFEAMCAALLGHPQMFGYCYTQLTDVFQEQNGIYWFDRSPKFDLERIREIQQRPAAIEGHVPVPRPGEVEVVPGV
jgi:beta-galactosidase/beta-glucuronidase